MTGRLRQISPSLYRFEDTCNVYVICSSDRAVLVDFGTGEVLDHLPSLGVKQVSDVLMTHYHRDQGQGLGQALPPGARLWVPHTEQDYFLAVEAFWQSRPIFNNYDMRQDRFSLLQEVVVSGTLRDYTTCPFGHHTFTIVPTPGHTPGSISLLAEIDGRQSAFTGDLIAAPGKIWSLSATQWTYTGAEGAATSILSLLDLKDREPDALLPSHGEVLAEPGPAIDLLVERLWQLLRERRQNLSLLQLREQPYRAITPHLLIHCASNTKTYVLLSDSGRALMIDFGYDFVAGLSPGADRASRRPWLYTLPGLKRDWNVERVDAVLPTHFHDDHVAGFNLLREVEGAEVWAAETLADILEEPAKYNLPCLWYDPILVDRRLPIGQPIHWQEYTLTLHPLPGHTSYAVAIEFEVDGYRALAVGDQYEGGTGLGWNYVYQNRFEIGDYRLSADLLERINPHLILSGHWEPLWVQSGYFAELRGRGEILEHLHRQLLPLEEVDFGAEGFGLRLRPYQVTARSGQPLQFEVEVRNPFAHAAPAEIRVVLPAGWLADLATISLHLEPKETRLVTFQVTPPKGHAVRRARLAADLTVGDHRFGQQAEALVTIYPEFLAENSGLGVQVFPVQPGIFGKVLNLEKGFGETEQL
jgi:glyoxylase-like metal-dependent hydrolase (beta-lactamase superfamily II)